MVPSTAAVSTAWPSAAVDPLAEDRVERRAHRERQVQPVGEVGQRHPHQGVHRPAGDAVVEQRPHRRLAGGRDGLGVTGRRRHVLGDRLDDGVEHHVGADAGREEHRGPGERGELRPGVVGAERPSRSARSRGRARRPAPPWRAGRRTSRSQSYHLDHRSPMTVSAWSGATIAHSAMAVTPMAAARNTGQRGRGPPQRPWSSSAPAAFGRVSVLMNALRCVLSGPDRTPWRHGTPRATPAGQVNSWTD